MLKLTVVTIAMLSIIKVATAQDNPLTAVEPEETHKQCSIFQSEQWQGWIEPTSENDAKNMLNITGHAVLPTPGYKIEWTPQLENDAEGPKLHIALNTIPPNGIVIQLLTKTPVNIQLETPYELYSSISLFCGDQLLAELKDVKRKE